MAFAVHLKIFMEPDGEKAPHFLRFTPFATSEIQLQPSLLGPSAPTISPQDLASPSIRTYLTLSRPPAMVPFLFSFFNDFPIPRSFE